MAEKSNIEENVNEMEELENKTSKTENRESSENESIGPENQNNTDETAESLKSTTSKETTETLLAEQKEKYLRLYSEFENFRRRTAREKLEMIDAAGVDIIKDILPVLDDLNRAVKNNEKVDNIEAVKEGVTIIYNKFSKILENKGVSKLNTLNEDFNPEIHEALTKIPAPSKDLKGKVIDVIEDGYTLKSKVIRFAKVVVGE